MAKDMDEQELDLADQLKTAWQALVQNEAKHAATRADWMERVLTLGHLMVKARVSLPKDRSAGLGDAPSNRMHYWLKAAGLDQLDKNDRSAYCMLAGQEKLSREVIKETTSRNVQVLWNKVKAHPDYVRPEPKDDKKGKPPAPTNKGANKGPRKIKTLAENQQATLDLMVLEAEPINKKDAIALKSAILGLQRMVNERADNPLSFAMTLGDTEELAGAVDDLLNWLTYLNEF